MTARRSEISASLADRGRPENWATEAEAAVLSGVGPEVFAAELPELIRQGFPKPSGWTGKWWTSSIREFWYRNPSLAKKYQRNRTLPNPVIYFLKATESGRIKIGFASNVQRRIASISTSCPEDLQLLGCCPGTMPEEQALHRKFAHLRIRREWFRGEPELLAYIAEVTK